MQSYMQIILVMMYSHITQMGIFIKIKAKNSYKNQAHLYVTS